MLITSPPTLGCVIGFRLQAEAEYCKAVLADTEALQEKLYQEMRGRIQEADQSAPVRYAVLCFDPAPKRALEFA